jgi:hypothetical protein
VTKICNKPKCPSKSEWIETMWSEYTVEYYLATKKEGNSVICDDVDESERHIMLGEVSQSQSQKDKYCDLTFTM